MIERYAFIKLDDDHANPEGRAAVAARARTDLAAIPGVIEVVTGVAGDDYVAERWDVSIVIRFRSVDDYPPYRDHPRHRSFVDDFVAPISVARKAWSFDVGDDGA